MKLGAKNAMGWKAVSLAVVCALMLGTLTACDEDVNTTLVAGMNEAASAAAVTLINAAFQVFAADGDSNSTGSLLGGDTVPQT